MSRVSWCKYTKLFDYANFSATDQRQQAPDDARGDTAGAVGGRCVFLSLAFDRKGEARKEKHPTAHRHRERAETKTKSSREDRDKEGGEGMGVLFPSPFARKGAARKENTHPTPPSSICCCVCDCVLCFYCVYWLCVFYMRLLCSISAFFFGLDARGRGRRRKAPTAEGEERAAARQQAARTIYPWQARDTKQATARARPRPRAPFSSLELNITTVFMENIHDR